jgi:hypothetical protein
MVVSVIASLYAGKSSLDFAAIGGVLLSMIGYREPLACFHVVN